MDGYSSTPLPFPAPRPGALTPMLVENVPSAASGQSEFGTGWLVFTVALSAAILVGCGILGYCCKK